MKNLHSPILGDNLLSNRCLAKRSELYLRIFCRSFRLLMIKNCCSLPKSLFQRAEKVFAHCSERQKRGKSGTRSRHASRPPGAGPGRGDSLQHAGPLLEPRDERVSRELAGQWTKFNEISMKLVVTTPILNSKTPNRPLLSLPVCESLSPPQRVRQ